MTSQIKAAAEILLNNPQLLGLFCALFGLITGSFLNVVIYRIPKMLEQEWEESCGTPQASPSPHPPDEQPSTIRKNLLGRAETSTSERKSLSLFSPRSHCPKCHAPITFWRNIPVASWILQRGRCHACQTPIPWRYPLVELLSCILFFVAYCLFGATTAGFGAMVFAAFLIGLTFIDFETYLLPDNLTLPLLWTGLLLNLSATFSDLNSAVLGAIFGYLSLWSVYWLFRLTTGKEGMGYGDFKLLAALGAWLGWQALIGIIILSSLLGSIVGLSGIALFGHSRHSPIPFGPYLAIAGLIALYSRHHFQKFLVGFY